MKSILLVVLTLLPFASATQLWINYYHETMMTENNVVYIPRTLEQVDQDMADISTVTSHVKFFANPFYDENIVWVRQVNGVAKAKGMHTSVTFLADRQTLTAENWDDYANRVVDACAQFEGTADTILVGNEITLRSSMTPEEIQQRVVVLMDRCRAVFPGEVSYQEFWHARHAWRGYNGRIYFMMYENFDSFNTNMADMQREFPNAGIGEWGEDLWEDQNLHDEAWQADQTQKRWAIIQNANVPVAYVFAYREPTFNSFSMVRPDGTHRPLWAAFGGAHTPAQSCVSTLEYLDGMDNNCNTAVDENYVEGPRPDVNQPAPSVPEQQPPAEEEVPPVVEPESPVQPQPEPAVEPVKKKSSGGGSSRPRVTATANVTRNDTVNATPNATVRTNSTYNGTIRYNGAPVILSITPEVTRNGETVDAPVVYVDDTRLLARESHTIITRDVPSEPVHTVTLWTRLRTWFSAVV